MEAFAASNCKDGISADCCRKRRKLLLERKHLFVFPFQNPVSKCQVVPTSDTTLLLVVIYLTKLRKGTEAWDTSSLSNNLPLPLPLYIQPYAHAKEEI